MAASFTQSGSWQAWLLSALLVERLYAYLAPWILRRRSTSITASTAENAPRSSPSPSPAAGKYTRMSQVEMTEILLPNQADMHGVAFSGTLMAWMDVCAGIAAKTHAGLPCVTASVDAVHFLRPIHVGDVVVLKAAVNRVHFRTTPPYQLKPSSPSIDLAIEHGDWCSCGSRRHGHGSVPLLLSWYHHSCQVPPRRLLLLLFGIAYLTFVALRDGKAVAVPPVIPETGLEKAWFEAAETRRVARMERKKIQAEEGAKRQGSAQVVESRHPFIADAAFQFPPLASKEDGEHRGVSITQTSSMQGYPSTKSYTQNVQLIMPQHANSLGITFGGYIIRLMERCAVVSAARHAQRSSMTDPAMSTPGHHNMFFRTASIDSLQFLLPTRVGDLITVRAYVSRAFKRSMEVYVTVHSQSLHTKAFSDSPQPHADHSGNVSDEPAVSEWKLTNDGYLTVVAFDEQEQQQQTMQVKGNTEYPLSPLGPTAAGTLLTTSTTTDHHHNNNKDAEEEEGDFHLLPLLPQTNLERWRYEQASERRERRLRERDELKVLFRAQLQ